jgi:hypothetical protein
MGAKADPTLNSRGRPLHCGTVTTGPAEEQTVRVGDPRFTLFFPNTHQPPTVRIEGDAAVVGRQRGALNRGHLELAVVGL